MSDETVLRESVLNLVPLSVHHQRVTSSCIEEEDLFDCFDDAVAALLHTDAVLDAPRQKPLLSLSTTTTRRGPLSLTLRPPSLYTGERRGGPETSQKAFTDTRCHRPILHLLPKSRFQPRKRLKERLPRIGENFRAFQFH